MFLAPESRRVNRARVAIRKRAGAIRRSLIDSTHRARRRSPLYSGLPIRPTRPANIYGFIYISHINRAFSHARHISVPPNSKRRRAGIAYSVLPSHRFAASEPHAGQNRVWSAIMARFRREYSITESRQSRRYMRLCGPKVNGHLGPVYTDKL